MKAHQPRALNLQFSLVNIAPIEVAMIHMRRALWRRTYRLVIQVWQVSTVLVALLKRHTGVSVGLAASTVFVLWLTCDFVEVALIQTAWA